MKVHSYGTRDEKRSLGLSIILNLTNVMMLPHLYGAQYVHSVSSSVANISFVTSDTYITLYLKLKMCWFLNKGCGFSWKVITLYTITIINFALLHLVPPRFQV